MRQLKVICRPFEIISEDGESDLVYTDVEDGQDWLDPKVIADATEIIECDPDEYDDRDAMTIAADWLNNNGLMWEPDTVPGTPSWFSGRDEGYEGEEWSAHFEGDWSKEERAEIGRRVYGHRFT